MFLPTVTSVVLKSSISPRELPSSVFSAKKGSPDTWPIYPCRPERREGLDTRRVAMTPTKGPMSQKKQVAKNTPMPGVRPRGFAYGRRPISRNSGSQIRTIVAQSRSRPGWHVVHTKTMASQGTTATQSEIPVVLQSLHISERQQEREGQGTVGHQSQQLGQSQLTASRSYRHVPF